MFPDWMAMVGNHGCEMVETPDAFTQVGKNIFVFSPYVEPPELLRGLEAQPVGELGLFVGNDIRYWIDIKGKCFSG